MIYIHETNLLNVFSLLIKVHDYSKGMWKWNILFYFANEVPFAIVVSFLQISISYGQFTIIGQPIIKNIVEVPSARYCEVEDPTRYQQMVLFMMIMAWVFCCTL